MKKRSTIALILLTAILAILAFFQTPIMTQIRHKTWLAITITTGNLFSIKDVNPSEDVFTQTQKLLAENIRLKAELKQYSSLRDQLGSPSFDAYQPVPARISGRPLSALQPQLVINKGLADGVTIGSPAVIQGSVLVGFVSETSERTAVISTLLHPETNLSVETVPMDTEKPPARGLLQSRHNTSLHITTVPRDIEIHNGQAVVTISKDVTVPAGLMIGSLAHIENQEHEAYQEARVVLPYDLDRIDAVFILAAP